MASKSMEEEIKSEFYELRKGKVWFSEEIKREQRKLKTSLFRYVLRFPIFRGPHGAIYLWMHHSVRDARSFRLRLSGCLLSGVWNTEGAAQRLHGD